MEEIARRKAFIAHHQFWAQFSRDELIKLSQGDTTVEAKFHEQGGDKVNIDFNLVLTEEERQKYETDATAFLRDTEYLMYLH